MPDAQHKLCVFHVIAEIDKLILKEVRKIRRELKPKQIKKGRRRPSKKQQTRIEKLKKKQAQADALFRQRHALVRKRSRMNSK